MDTQVQATHIAATPEPVKQLFRLHRQLTKAKAHHAARTKEINIKLSKVEGGLNAWRQQNGGAPSLGVAEGSIECAIKDNWDLTSTQEFIEWVIDTQDRTNWSAWFNKVYSKPALKQYQEDHTNEAPPCFINKPYPDIKVKTTKE